MTFLYPTLCSHVACKAFSKTFLRKLVKITVLSETMLLFVLALLMSQIAMLEILPFAGSTMTLLIIAAIAVIALAVFRLLVPLIIAVIIVVVLLILIFGGIPVP
jgi:hypothetical protein